MIFEIMFLENQTKTIFLHNFFRKIHKIILINQTLFSSVIIHDVMILFC